MSAGPEVSIIMPVRNVAASLDAALASVCSQATDASVEVIVVGWRVRETPARLAHQYYAYGRGKFTTLLRHPSSLHLHWLAPQMLVGSLAAGILLSWTTPGRVMLAMVGGSYALYLVAGATILGSRVGVRLALTWRSHSVSCTSLGEPASWLQPGWRCSAAFLGSRAYEPEMKAATRAA